MLLSSDEEDEVEVEEEPEVIQVGSDESDATTHSSSTKSSVASKKKKLCIKGSSEEEEEEEERPKKEKKSKKEKKKKEKKEKRRNEEENNGFDDDDDDYMRGGGASDDSDFEGENYTEDQKVAILEMFNNASVEDIQSMISISKNRVKSLVECRPFTDFADLVIGRFRTLGSDTLAWVSLGFGLPRPEPPKKSIWAWIQNLILYILEWKSTNV